MCSSWDFEIEYRTGSSPSPLEFYERGLSQCTEYWRAAGYFSSSLLSAIAHPLRGFVGRGGRIRLITSVELQDNDVRAIEAGADREQLSLARLLEQLREMEDREYIPGGELLSLLLQAGRLEIRIAIPTTGTGMYHEKLGVFLAANGSYVAFAGSANETRRALEENFECIDVFAAWKEPERAGKKKAHFEELWENRRDGLLVVSFPEAAKCRLLKILAWQAMNSNEGTGYPTREEHEAGSSCGVGEADLAPC